MSLTIETAIDWIHSRLSYGSRPGLARVKALLAKLDHPENKVPTIHIAGTNGKGSTVTYLRCMLEELGLTVGTFTSPYIESFNERIAINGQPLSNEQLIAAVEKFQPLVEDLDQQSEVAGITEFETITVMALDYFNQQKVDIAIIEVGLGGLLDSTNVVVPMLTAITTIGKDHTEILGESLAEIAYQKAGIIKAGIPVVTGKISLEAMMVIEEVAAEKNSLIYRYDHEYQVKYRHPDPQWGEVFDFYAELGKLSKVKVPLLGRHQTENAAVAIQLFYLYCLLKQLNFQQRDIYNGLLHAKWPARMERLSEEPLIVLDGAHNEHAMRRLAENLKKEFPSRQIHILFSSLASKNYKEMIGDLRSVPNIHLYLTSFDYPGAIDLSQLEEFADATTEIVSLWQFGLGEILEKMSSDDMLLVTGSLYFVSQVRELLLTLGGSDD